jgi:hypothetical protein
MNGCDYLLQFTKETPSNAYVATLNLACEVGKQVEVHVYENAAKHTASTSMCTTKTPAQSNLQTIDLTNEPANGETPKDFLVGHLNLASITSTSEGSAFLCGAAHNATATLQGTTRLKADNIAGEPQGLTISEGGEEVTEDAQMTLAEFPATITGEQAGGNLVFTREGRTVTCETATFDATVQADDSKTTLTMTPTYSACHAMILGQKIPATVTTNGCDYLLRFTKSTPTNRYIADTDLVCEAGKQVEIHVYEDSITHAEGKSLCTFKIPPQANLSTIELTNEPASESMPKDSIVAHVNLTGITSTSEGIPFVCAATHSGTATSMGTLRLRADNSSGESQSLTVSGDPEPKGTDDAQMTLSEFPAVFTGEQFNGSMVFTREGRTFTCETAKFDAEVKATDSKTTLTVTPTYSNCHSISLGTKFPVTVTMNGCDYLLRFTKATPSGTYTADTDLVCPGTNKVEVHVYENAAKHTAGTSMCTTKTPAQSNLQAIDLTNEPANAETPKNFVVGHLSLAGITSTSEGSVFICGAAHSATATITGTIRLKADNSLGAAQGVTISDDVETP